MAGLEASGQDLLDPGQKKDASLTDFDYRVYGALGKIVGKGFLAKDFLGYMVDYLALNQPLVPIGQVVGFTQTVPQAASTIATREGTTSTTYTNLATTGPELTGLPDGQYLIFFGASLTMDAAGSTGHMSIQVNGTTAVDGDDIRTTATTMSTGSRAVLKTLDAGGANTVTAKYRTESGAVTADFLNRWLIAFKTANP